MFGSGKPLGNGMASPINRFVSLLAPLTLTIFAFASLVRADTKYSDEYLQRVTAAKTVSPLDNNLFGDSINDYSGGVQFSQTDVSLPGNFGLSVGVGRRYAIADKTGLSAAQKIGGIFGDWDLDLPHMEGVYGPQGHQAMTLAGANVRCDVTSWDQARPPFVDYFQAEEYWHGNHLYLPGQGAEEVLYFESGDKPTDPLNYRWVTDRKSVV